MCFIIGVAGGLLFILGGMVWLESNETPPKVATIIGATLLIWLGISSAEFDQSKISVETAHKICNCLAVEVDNQIYNVHEQIKTDVNEGDPIRITVKEGWSYGIYHERRVKLETIPE